MSDHMTDQRPYRFFRRITRKLGQFIWSIFILSLTIYIGGFLVYVAEYQRAAQPLFDTADGIVVLTGGPDRIGEAVRLLSEKHAGRLFISGVNEQTDEDDLVRAIPTLAKFMACCVTIDRNAQNTHENALQTIAWARKNHFNSLIIVTAHAHMPRALFEIRTSAGDDLKISPWRVGGPPHAEDWWHDIYNVRAMLIEYSKMTGSILRYLYLTFKIDLAGVITHA